MTATASILLAAESLAANNSGIGRVTRLMAKVLQSESEQGRVRARALSLNDPAKAEASILPTTLARGSRARFVMEAVRARTNCDHFIYDFLGMSRAHLPLPVLRRPFMTWLHGIEVWEHSRRARLAVARRASLLIANTRYTLERATRVSPVLEACRHRARVCWLATETDDAAPASGDGDRRPTALILGRIDAAGGYKGHVELIDCWHRVVSAVPDARLIIAGGGVGLTVLQRLAAASPVHDSIELRGFTPERELDALWREATVFAMPSRGEGFGLVYAEAMRRGVPVIASVHDAAHEVSIDGETGYNVDLDRQHELPDRLVQLFRGRDHAAVLGENGRRRWRDHFCFSAFKRRFVPLLREFLSD